MDKFVEMMKNLLRVISTPILKIGESQISLSSIFILVIILWLTSFLSKAAAKLTDNLIKDAPIDSGLKNTIEKMVRYTVLLIGLFIALDSVGINLSSLAAIGAALMVGIGFGLQNITQNFISGLIILFQRPIKKGDLVEVKGVTGIVREIGSRSTLIHTHDDVAIIVPNSQFISEQVINDSFSGSKKRYHLKVGVAYGTDPHKVRETLLNVAKNNDKVLNTPVPDVFFTDFGESSLDFKLLVWLSDLWAAERILSDLRYEIIDAFKEQDIEIPFPQRDLHLRSSQIQLS